MMTTLITEWCPNYLTAKRNAALCMCEICKARQEMRPSQSVDFPLAVAGIIAAIYAWRATLPCGHMSCYHLAPRRGKPT